MEWIEKSLRPEGGSAAHLTAAGVWSRSYPETSGYIIETLLEYEALSGGGRWAGHAAAIGEWLIGIQRPDGAWAGGVHPARNPSPSVFNTGQILLGLAALYETTRDQSVLQSLARGAKWLADAEEGAGLWRIGNYRGEFNPTYYTRVTWPMLRAWKLTGDQSVREAAVRVLEHLRGRRNANGTFSDWGFRPGEPAFTHTIAYTLRGFIESGRLLDETGTYLDLVAPAVERLYRKSELRQGRLAGVLDYDWKGTNDFVCLTGNAQVGLVLLHFESHRPDLRLVNAAAKLVDFVCDQQVTAAGSGRFRGGIAGSHPIWGPYLRLRYPNWAAKFFADSLIFLVRRLNAEREALRR
jgi:hypothetical protein